MELDYTGGPKFPTVNKSVHLRADSNVQYLQLIDFIKYLWEKGHPDVCVIPTAPESISDPDKGYIVYGLESRAAQKDFSKPRYMEEICDDKVYHISMQSFDNFISFSAVHRNPRIAEEIIEAFEDFMIESTAVIKQVGAGEILYSRRYPDREEARIGRDMCVRTVVYRVFLQKIKKVELETIQEVLIEARMWWQKYQILVEIDQQATPNVSVILTDQATPNT